jgi:hypothetical protein
VAEDQPHDGQDGEPGEHHDELHPPDPEAGEADRAHDVDVEAADLAAREELNAVPHQEGQSDRHEQELEHVGAALSHGAPDPHLERDTERGGRAGRQQDGGDERHPDIHVEEERDVRAEGEQIAVGEVDEAEDPVDEPHGAQREVRARHEAVQRHLPDRARPP